MARSTSASASARLSPSRRIAGVLTDALSVLSGSKDDEVSWDTICTRRRRLSRSACPLSCDWIGTSLKKTVPAVGVSMPARMRASVDLPDPDSPTTPTAAPPLSTVSDTLSTAVCR